MLEAICLMKLKVLEIQSSRSLCGDYRKTLGQVKNVRLILTSPLYNIGPAEIWSQFGRRSIGTQRFHRHIEERIKREINKSREH